MIDDETGAPIKQYARNKIRTAKYTPLSFIPKNLYFQFQNVANIYFLFIVILGVCVIPLTFLSIAIQFFYFIFISVFTNHFSRHSQFLALLRQAWPRCPSLSL